MDNQLKTLRNIFNEKIFRIPDYQRGYAWSEVQLAEFWEDLVNLPSGMDHYTGMISLQKLGPDVTRSWENVQWKLDQGYSGHHVVDGQQRLTTFVILIQVLVEFMEQHSEPQSGQVFINSESTSAIRKQFLWDVDESSAAKLHTYIFGYEKDNPSYEFFKTRILDAEKSVDVEETFYTLNLENAKKFFEQRLQEIYDKYGDDDAAHAKALTDIQEIYRKLTQNMKFNQYIIENDFDVFVTFETMNNRGKRLTTLELLKNRLIYLSTLFSADEASKQELRREINKTWQTIYGYLGKNKNSPMSDDGFLREHCVVYFGYGKKQRKFDEFLLKDYFTQKRVLNYTVKVQEDIQLIADDLDSEADVDIEEDASLSSQTEDTLTLEDTLAYVRSLREMSKYWYDLYFPEQSQLPDELKIWLSRLLRCQSANFRPLIFALLSRSDIPTEEKVYCLKLIEEFIFFYFSLDGYSTNYQRTVYFNFAHDLFTGKVSLAKIIERLRNIACLEEHDGKRILKTNEVLNRITRLFNYDGYYSWPAIRYFLFEYEQWLKGMSPDTGREFQYNVFMAKEKNDHKMSIEHVFPQTPDKSDSSADAWVKVFQEYTAAQQKALNGSLGNLVLLSLPENISLQNDRFAQKCEARYQNGSVSEYQVCFDEKGHRREIWNAEAILDRGLKMLRFMAERWNFEFHHDYDKIRLLKLEFLREKPEDYIE